MIKIWLVTFSNGEEWHICGEEHAVMDYLQGTSMSATYKYVRWVPYSRKATSFEEGHVR